MTNDLTKWGNNASAVRNILLAIGAICAVVIAAVHTFDRIEDNAEKIIEVETLLLESNDEFIKEIGELQTEVHDLRDDVHIISCFVRHNGDENARKDCELEGI